MARCDERLSVMFAAGAVEEVRALMDREDVSPTAPVRLAIGVREIADWLTGNCTRDEAIARARLATRRYAKRQYTWFRNQPPATWPRDDGEDRDRAIALLSG